MKHNSTFFLVHLALVPVVIARLRSKTQSSLQESSQGMDHYHGPYFCPRCKATQEGGISDNFFNIECTVSFKPKQSSELVDKCQDPGSSGDGQLCGVYYYDDYSSFMHSAVNVLKEDENPHKNITQACLLVKVPEMVAHARFWHLPDENNRASRARITFVMDTSKSTTKLLTPRGFLAARLPAFVPPQHQQEPRKEMHDKYYVAISGGGWRSISISMGIFRGLKPYLKHVDAFSSVSGGSWFLTQLAFDQKFAKSVLGTNARPIEKEITKWFETHYFPKMMQKDVEYKEVPQGAIAAAIDKLAVAGYTLPGIGQDMILMARGFDWSWKKMVEQAVLKQETSARTIHDAPVQLQHLYKNEAQFAFNWNTVNQWRYKNHKFGIRKHGESKNSQFPLYTTLRRPVRGRISIKMADHEQANFSAFDGNLDTKFEMDLDKITIGEVATASSAALGGLAVHRWVENIIKLVRSKFPGKIECLVLGQLLSKLAHPDVKTKAMEFTGCSAFFHTFKPKSDPIATEWAEFFKDMAVPFPIKSRDPNVAPVPENQASPFLGIDAGYSDNNGFAPLLADWGRAATENQTAKGRMLVLMNNQFGDHQIDDYFEGEKYNGRVEPPYNGKICVQEGLTSDAEKEVYASMEFVKAAEHYQCAIDNAAPVYFEGAAPQQHRFDDPEIPTHVTFAYHPGAKIVANQHFMKTGERVAENGKTIDLLFLISNAPAETASVPVMGSESYASLGGHMEKAIEELKTKFPDFFPQHPNPSV